ncbi:hypothetical protein ACEE08_08630, partial [Staphylococcus rostri]
MENKEHTQFSQSNEANHNLDFAVSFIAGTLIGSVVGYAVKPFVTHVVNYTQEHELTNVSKQSQKIRQEALRKAEEIKGKAQQIKADALHKKEDQLDEPTVAQREAQQRAIRSEVDSDRLEAPTKPTYHFSEKKDKPVELATLKTRHQTMSDAGTVETVEPSTEPKEEVAVSSLAAMRQAMAADKPVATPEKAVEDKPKAAEKEEV